MKPQIAPDCAGCHFADPKTYSGITDNGTPEEPPESGIACAIHGWIPEGQEPTDGQCLERVIPSSNPVLDELSIRNSWCFTDIRTLR